MGEKRNDERWRIRVKTILEQNEPCCVTPCASTITGISTGEIWTDGGVRAELPLAKSPTVGRVSSEKRIDTPGGIDEPVTMSCKWRRCGIAVPQYPTKIVICKPRVS